MSPCVKARLNQVSHACVCVCQSVCARPDQYELINRRRQLEGPWGRQIHTWCTQTHTHTTPLCIPSSGSLFIFFHSASHISFSMPLYICLLLFFFFKTLFYYFTLFSFTPLRLQSYAVCHYLIFLLLCLFFPLYPQSGLFCWFVGWLLLHASLSFSETK